VAADLGIVAGALFEGVMAPLVLGGPVRPGHAIGARTTLALGRGEWATGDPDLEARVQQARVRRARRLTPVDTLSAAAPAEWMLAAVLHDLLQAVSPTFDAPLRRRAAARILELARAALERVPEPTSVRDALSRHTWFARALEVARTDTTVSWWTGSHTYLGIDPPRRLQAWPDLRRVAVVSTPHRLLELAPLAIDRDRLIDGVARLLALSPLTDLATCQRDAPPFAWGEASLALVTTRPGRTLVLRALARLAPADVDAALGRATRKLLATRPTAGAPAVTLLAERTLAQAQGHTPPSTATSQRADAAFALGLGAVAATMVLEGPSAVWSEDERRRLRVALEAAAQSPAAAEATAMLGPPRRAGSV
jgi:hypothetical protein